MNLSEFIAAMINLAALIFVGMQVWLARQAIKENSKAQQQEWDLRRKQYSISVPCR